MAFKNDGGNFSSDALARMIGNKKGSMSDDDLKEYEAVPENSFNMTAGMLGSTNPIAGLEGAEANAARKAALNSELDVFGNTKVNPQNIIRDTTPLQPMPIEQTPQMNSAGSQNGMNASNGSDYFQKLLQMLNK